MNFLFHISEQKHYFELYFFCHVASILTFHWQLQAYEVCTKRGLTRERVFILGRMGNSRDALALIINELKDIQQVCEGDNVAAMSFHCD